MFAPLFRNFDKIIPASKFSAKNHNFFFKSCYVNTCPSSLYYNPELKTLPKGHSENPFTLALSTYSLLRQNNDNSSVLRQIEQNPALNEKPALQRVRALVEESVRETSLTIEDYYQQLKLLVESGKFDLTVQTCVEYIYISEHLSKPDRTLYNSVLFPTIKSKSDYLSLQNIIDLITSLEKANLLSDKALLKILIDNLSRKQLPSQRKTVNLSGWHVDRYEDIIEKKSQPQGELQQYYNDVNSGALLADYRRYFRSFVCGFWRLAVNRILIRESRGTHTFARVDLNDELAQLVPVLERLDKNVPELKASEVASSIRKSL